MHRSYRVDVRERPQRAGGEPLPLTVDLASALEHAEAEQARIGFRPGAYPQPLNMVRKMACSFGWDWGPDLQTAGLWQPVTVERWRVARIAAVRPLVTVSGDHCDGRRRGARRRRAVRARLCRQRDLAVSSCALGEHEVDGTGRGRRVERRGRGRRGPAGPVVAAGLRRAPPCTTSSVDAARRRRQQPLDTWRAPHRVPQRRARHHARRARHAVHLRRQRPADLRQGRQLDPRRPPARPASPATGSRAASTRPSAPA